MNRGSAILHWVWSGFFVAIAVSHAAPTAQAQGVFPSQTIEVVIHSQPGGGTDITARKMMVRAQRELDIDLVVVSRRGGSGANAHQYALGQPRDGHTVLALTQSHLYTIARGESPLTIDDVVGVARAMDDPALITVAGDSPHRSLAELIEASKMAPLIWGVTQVGGTEHIGLAQLANESGMTFEVVPFGGDAQAVRALMSGAIDATLPNVSEAASHVANGTLRALAVMSGRRLSEYPDVPTTYELGYPVKTSTIRGYWVLKGTPQDRIERLSAAMVKAMNHKTFAKYLKSAGLTPEQSVAGHRVWHRQIREEYAKAEATLRDLGLIN